MLLKATASCHWLFLEDCAALVYFTSVPSQSPFLEHFCHALRSLGVQLQYLTRLYRDDLVPSWKVDPWSATNTPNIFWFVLPYTKGLTNLGPTHLFPEARPLPNLDDPTWSVSRGHDPSSKNCVWHSPPPVNVHALKHGKEDNSSWPFLWMLRDIFCLHSIGWLNSAPLAIK